MSAKPRSTSNVIAIGGRVKPKPPGHLSTVAKKMYSELIADLWDAGILDSVDGRMVELAALEAETIRACTLDIAKRGYIVETEVGGYNGAAVRTTEAPNHSVAMRETAMKHQRQLLDLLGIGPSARARLSSLGIAGTPAAKGVPGLAAFGELKAVPGGKQKKRATG